MFDGATWLLAAGLALVAVLLAMTIAAAAQQRGADKLVNRSFLVQSRLMSVLSNLQDAETGQRGYIITGDSAFLQPYDKARLSLPDQLLSLATVMTDTPAQRASMASLRSITALRMGLLQQGVVLRRSGDRTGAADYVSQGASKRLMDTVRGEIGNMSAQESHILVGYQTQAKLGFERLLVLLSAGFALVIVLTVAKFLVASRRLASVAARRDELAATNAKLLAEAEDRENAERKIRQMQKLEAVGQLTGGIAHDFNNMLAIIIGSLDLALRRLSVDPAKAQSYIGHALDGANRAAALTNRLLAFSRQQSLEPTASDPNKLVSGLSEILRRTIGEQLQVETVLAGGIWSTNVDVSQLENAILNLCVNARDAMPSGGKLTIETSNAFLDEAYAHDHLEVRPGHYVLISVSDTGLGMPADVVAKAFEPFFTTKAVGKGTGLGLSQVFGFVKQSGGHVEIYSEVNAGTSIKLYLPRWIGEDVAVTGPPALEPLPTASSKQTILVVEDEDAVRAVCVEALQEVGYTIFEASSGKQALLELERHPAVDLLFSDVVMPGMSGPDLASAARAIQPQLKVLFTTGYARNAVIHNGILDPGVMLLPKPFTLNQLFSKVGEALSVNAVEAMTAIHSDVSPKRA